MIRTCDIRFRSPEDQARCDGERHSRNIEDSQRYSVSNASARIVEREDVSGQFVGVVETALAEALEVAIRAQKWELVAQLTSELTARRHARENKAHLEIGRLPLKAIA